MEYRFLAQSDETLLELCKLPRKDGIAVALRSTGYESGTDEVLELAIVSLDGETLFSQVVKPQGVESWAPSDAAGNLSPADVEEAPELFQFEEEISELFEKASIVVAAHMPYMTDMVEASWVTLPDYTGFDVVELFLETHSSADDPTEPATAAALDGIADYFGVKPDGDDLLAAARTVAACYGAFVEECIGVRDAKGEDYWRRYEERKAAEARVDNAAYRSRERFLNRMNGALWLVGGIIFTSLVIQNYQGGGNMMLLIAFGVIAGFCYARGIANIFRKP